MWLVLLEELRPFLEAVEQQEHTSPPGGYRPALEAEEQEEERGPADPRHRVHSL